jgi:hypothetical protein
MVTPELVEQCDIGPVLSVLAPAQFSNQELATLCGKVRLRFANTIYSDDLFARPQGRRFVRALHKAWPWAGYFLKCGPITPVSSQTEVIDAGVLVAWALCLTDHLSVVRDDLGGVSLTFNPQQFKASVDGIVADAEELCRKAGLTKRATRLRARTIRSTVGSFFALGEKQNDGPG